MYVYLHTGLNSWSVGFYDPNRKWIEESIHPTSEDAAARVHYLNGGTRGG